MAQPGLCGLILAAGESSRMGRDKALLQWPPASLDHASPGSTLLEAALRTLQPITQQMVVVAGKNRDALAPIVARYGAILAQNPAPDRGQFSSIAIGLGAAIECGCESVAMTPVDSPPLRAGTLRLLQAAFAEALARGLWAVAPEHNGRHGHPLFAAPQLIDAFLHAEPTSNARIVLQTYEKFIEYFRVDDPLVGVEMNTPQEYAALAPLADARTV